MLGLPSLWASQDIPSIPRYILSIWNAMLGVSRLWESCSVQLRTGPPCFFCCFLHAGLKIHHHLGIAPENCCWTSMCSSIYVLLAYSVYKDCFVLLNIWQPILSTHLKGANVKTRQYSSTATAKIGRGKELRGANATFHRTDSQLLLWFRR